MAARRRAPQISQMESDATEFGVGVRCGGWRLGLLVARNVTKVGQGARSDLPTSGQVEKVSANQFAKLAGVSSSTVDYYYNAWELAAKSSLVPAAAKIQPGDDDVCVDADAIEDEDNPHTHWTYFYQLAKNPPKDSKPKEDNKKPQLSVVDDEEDESESVDEDFGLVEDEQMSEDEKTEADAEIQKDDLLSVLESLRALNERVAAIDVLGDNDQILLQIATAALELESTAKALSAKSEAA